MKRCTYCGINLAKIDPAHVIEEMCANANSSTPTGRLWCSQQCLDWTRQKEQRGGRRAV